MNKFLVWNYRGIGAPRTLSHLTYMIKDHKPNMIALLETRVHSSRAIDILTKTHLTNVEAVEACGFVGGIWLLWDWNTETVEVISKNDQALNAVVHMDNGRFWLLTVIYASPNPLYRQELWEYLKSLGSIMAAPWIAIEDFNQVVASWEKKGGRNINSNQANRLRAVIDCYRWVDLGFTGPRFTWKNGS